MQSVDQPGRGDDCGAVLIIVEHRNIQQLAQPLLDDEAFRRLDVFEVDAAEGRMQKAHAIDEFVDIAGVDFEIDRIDIGKALEQRRLALHHRLGRQRAEVAEAKHRGAVRDHRDEIALRGVIERGGSDRAGCAGRGRQPPENRRETDRAASSAVWSPRSKASRDGRCCGTAGPRLRWRECCRYPCFSTLLIRSSPNSARARALLRIFNLRTAPGSVKAALRGRLRLRAEVLEISGRIAVTVTRDPPC